MSALPTSSDINLFCYRERVIDFDAEIVHRALDLCVTAGPNQTADRKAYLKKVNGHRVDAHP
jgi:hypothetical protein